MRRSKANSYFVITALSAHRHPLCMSENFPLLLQNSGTNFIFLDAFTGHIYYPSISVREGVFFKPGTLNHIFHL